MFFKFGDKEDFGKLDYFLRKDPVQISKSFISLVRKNINHKVINEKLVDEVWKKMLDLAVLSPVKEVSSD
jgi:hypothetical protein